MLSNKKSTKTVNKRAKNIVLPAIFLISAVFAAIFPVQAAEPVPLDPTTAETQEQLQNQLKEIERQIAELEQQLKTATTEKNTLAGQLKQLKTEQSKINLEIQSTNFLIGDLADKIDQTAQSIDLSEARMQKLREQISQALLEVYQRDKTSFVATLASEQGLTGFFKEVDDFKALSQSLSGSLREVRQLKVDLEDQEKEFQDRKQSAQGLLELRASQQRDLNGKITAQSSLLQNSQSKESQVAVVLGYNKQVAAQIRSQIYNLLGITTEVTFGQALDIANTVSASTGVRAAFLLAVLTQESNLGKNVGTCNRPGDPPEKSWREIMKPDRDQAPFQTITAELGLDIDTTPVSCPMRDKKGKRVGWGGAMGPAQFIPSTWMGYKDKVSAITGKLANPFDIRDAFYAAGIKLAAGGATNNGEKGEWDAAMRYFSGNTNPRNRFYGDSVLAIARKYQNDINTLAN